MSGRVQHNFFNKGFIEKPHLKPLLPALIFGIVLTWLSLSAGVALPDASFSPDKVAHLGAYGLWAWLWAWGRRRARRQWGWMAIAAGCAAWGLLLEGVQGWLPWRSFEWADALANAAGAVAGSWINEFFHHKTT